jgi:hypothetical protein
MTHTEWLSLKATAYWAAGQPLPLDLFTQMNEAGMDVDAEERNFNLMEQYD